MYIITFYIIILLIKISLTVLYNQLHIKVILTRKLIPLGAAWIEPLSFTAFCFVNILEKRIVKIRQLVSHLQNM